MRAAPKEQPKTTEAIASELIGGRLSSSAFRCQDSARPFARLEFEPRAPLMDARWNPTTADAGHSTTDTPADPDQWRHLVV